MWRPVGFLVSCLFLPSLVFAQSSSVSIDALVPGCGNGLIENGEACDGTNYAGQSCSTLGFGSGTISCSSSCTISTASCVVMQPAGNKTQSTRVRLTNFNTFVIQGVTTPGSTVWVLRDGLRVGTGQSDALGQFQIALAKTIPGRYQFSLLAETPQGLRTASFSFPYYISGLGTTKFERILMSPTIDTDQSTISLNTTFNVYGESSPNNEVTTVLYKDGSAKVLATSSTDGSGRYKSILTTTGLVGGDYTILSYVTEAGQISGPSRVLGLQIGNFPIPRYRDFNTCPFIRGDVNKDCRVNYGDIAPLRSWLKGIGGAGTIEQERLSGDGRIDMKDFSIILYNWTG